MKTEFNISYATYIYKKPFIFMGKNILNSMQLAGEFLENWDIAISVFRRGNMENFWSEYVSMDEMKKIQENSIIFHDIYNRMWSDDYVLDDILFQKVFHLLEPGIEGIPFLANNNKGVELTSYPEFSELFATVLNPFLSEENEDRNEEKRECAELVLTDIVEKAFPGSAYVDSAHGSFFMKKTIFCGYHLCQMIEEGIFFFCQEDEKKKERYKEEGRIRRYDFNFDYFRETKDIIDKTRALQKVFFEMAMILGENRYLYLGSRVYRNPKELSMDIEKFISRDMSRAEEKWLRYIGELVVDDEIYYNGLYYNAYYFKEFLIAHEREDLLPYIATIEKNYVRPTGMSGMDNIWQDLKKEKKEVLWPDETYLGYGSSDEHDRILHTVYEINQEIQGWLKTSSLSGKWKNLKDQYVAFCKLLDGMADGEAAIWNQGEKFELIKDVKERAKAYKEWEQSLRNEYECNSRFVNALSEHKLYTLYAPETEYVITDKVYGMSSPVLLTLYSCAPIEENYRENCVAAFEYMGKQTLSRDTWEEILNAIHLRITRKLIQDKVPEEVIEFYFGLVLDKCSELELSVEEMRRDILDYLDYSPRKSELKPYMVSNIDKSIREVSFSDDYIKDVLEVVKQESCYKEWEEAKDTLKTISRDLKRLNKEQVNEYENYQDKMEEYFPNAPYIANFRFKITELEEYKRVTIEALTEEKERWTSQLSVVKNLHDKVAAVIEIAKAEKRRKEREQQEERERRIQIARDKAKKEKERKEKIKKIKSLVIKLAIAGAILIFAIVGIVKYRDKHCSNVYYGTSFYFGQEDYTDYIVADNVESIPADLFAGSTNMESIILPDGLKHIEDRAFYGCANLKSIVLPDSVETIGAEAFYGCELLKEIEMPKNLISVGQEAFSNCYGLEMIEWNENLKEIGERAFAFAGLKTLDGAPLEVIQAADYSEENIPFVNCRNMNVTEEETEILSFNSLYRMAAPGVALIENEQQIINLLAGETIADNVQINPHKGHLMNIKFEENNLDKADFSFEYLEGGYIYNVTGKAIREEGEVEVPAPVYCEFDEVRTFFDKDVLLTTNIEGAYTNLIQMMNTQSLVYGDTTVTLENKVIQNLEVLSVDEQMEGEDKSITVGVKGQVLGGFTTYSFDGNLKVASTTEGITSEFTTTSLSDSGISFLGVYSDGTENVRITGQLGDYLYLGNSRFIDTTADCESGFYYFEYGEYSCHRRDVYIDYDNGIINIEGWELKKIGELKEGDSTVAGLTGIWKGNMLDKGIPYTAYCFDNGYGGIISAVIEWEYTTAKGTPRYGTYVSHWTLDSDSGEIELDHGAFYELTDGYHQRVFYGTLSSDGNSIVTGSGTLVRQ